MNEHTPPASAQTDRFVQDRMPPADQWPRLHYDLPESQLPDQLNLVHALLDRAVDEKGWGNRPMLRSASLDLDYAQARDRVDRIARVLTEDYQLQPGNRVLLRGTNSIGLALAWLAVVKAGGIAVATMPLLRAGELGKIIDKAQPTLAICEAALIGELETAQRSHPGPGRIVRYGSADDPQDLGTLCQAKEAGFPACPTAADDIALLAFTSGTTGTPKAAIHTHRDVLAACEAWPRHVLRATPDDIVLGSPPLAFTFGLGGLLLFPMWAGASVYFPDGLQSPEGVVELLGRVRVTILYTAPTFYRKMAPLVKQHDVGALRQCVSAGEALPDATRQLWKEASGIDIIDGIGATEMFHIFISSAGADIRAGAIGKVVPGYRAKVVDEACGQVPHGSIGRLAVTGPTGCRYLDDERQQRYVQDGWNYPGDAFTQDADGYFYYQARDDDMIVSAGYNIGGPEVEDALLTHPAVAECAVIGQPDAERGMIVKAFCVLKPGQVADAMLVKALQEHVKQQIAPYKYPRIVEFAAELPRTSTGKLQRFRLRDTD